MIEPFGDRAWRIALPLAIHRGALIARLRALPGAIDAHASESHACVRFAGEPARIDESILDGLEVAPAVGREHRIEVVYDGEDLDEVARMADMSREDVIARHAASEHSVSFVGFLPGFAYLRGLDQALASIPRRGAPRERVPARAVAIAGGFSGIYPFATPGGWHLIGSAPRFEPLEGEHVRLRIGDRVRLVRIG